MEQWYRIRSGSGRRCIVGHNHPSGDPAPSSADRRYTEDVAAAAKLLGIGLLDHLIVAPGGSYFSFLDEGLL